MTSDQHLVVLRGNSGSGKTTLARRLQLAMGRGTANVGQDHLRRIVLREHEVENGHSIGLIEQTARYCLGIGYHVILEGILAEHIYGAMLRDLVAAHRGPAHVFYLDIPLEETLRRHETRPMRLEVEPERLHEWYRPHDLLCVPGEVVLGPELSEDELLGRLLAAVGGPRP